MSLNAEITRIENAKTTLKTKLNSRNDNQHQITNELIDEYGDFVDSIPEREIDWSEIGYSETPQFVQDGYDYAKTIYDNWDSSQSMFFYIFANNKSLIFMPLVETSNGFNFSGMFSSCQALTTIPQLDTSNGIYFSSMFISCTSLTTVPQLDTSSGTDFSGMFASCTSLTTVPQLDTSSGTDFDSMFASCTSLTTIPQLNTSSGTDFDSMFSSCKALTTIPQLNTSNGTIFQSMFQYCTSLTTIPQLNTSNGTNFSSMFSYCSNLVNVPQLDTSSGTDFLRMFQYCFSLATFGGLENIGQAYSTNTSANYSNYTLDLSSCSRLTHDSLMNVINNLYDIATKGCNTQQLVLGSTNLAKLSASEISTATNKGWSVS